MRRSGLLLSWKFEIGILVWATLLIPRLYALRGSAVVLQAKAKIAEHKLEADDENNGTSSANVTKSPLTGIPQIDYILDPNLPRELNGHNLTDYPFFNAIPQDISFNCEGHHDGFYASVPHKCQVYHHCLFGTRFDFLCANYTAFDQRTFICHFVSEVDCEHSPKHYNRNEALYKPAATTTTSTTTTSTTTAPTAASNSLPSANGGGGGNFRYIPSRRRRPHHRRRPMYEYYYDDDEYADADYYDDEAASFNNRRTPYRKQNKDAYGNENRDSETDYDSHVDQIKPSVRSSNVGASIYDRTRVAPKIRRPVPKSERSKYEYVKSSATVVATSTTTEKSQSQQQNSKKQPAPTTSDYEYYEGVAEAEYDYEEPKAKTKHHADYDFPTGFEETRRYTGRHRGRMPVRKRTEIMYDDYDLKERPRMNRRKEYNGGGGGRYDNERPRNIRPMYPRNKNRHEDEYKHAQSGHKKRIMDGDYRAPVRRPESKRVPASDDDYYYDDEFDEREELPPKRRRLQNEYNKTKPNPTKPSGQTERSGADEKQPEPTNVQKHANRGLTSNQRNAKSNTLENEGSTKEQTPYYNEVSTTENVNNLTSSVQKYSPGRKTAKLANNNLLVQDETSDDDIVTDVAYTENSSPSTKSTESTSPTPRKYVTANKMVNAQNQQKSQTFHEELDYNVSKYTDGEDKQQQQQNKTVTPIRHFVITMPMRKPSQFSTLTPQPSQTEKPQKLPEQKFVANNYHGKPTQQYVKITSPRNSSSSYAGDINLGNYLLPVRNNNESPSQQSTWSPTLPNANTRPVQEKYSLENLNIISNGINYSNGFISEPKPFTNDASSKSPNYRQENRPYTSGERLYTKSISFPHQPPSNYDITAPGPSAPGEPSAPDKKYADIRAYTTNVDYDVTYNDALQPSTLHPVRRYPSTTFFVQNQPQRTQRMPAEYAFNESALNTLNRSQSRYK